MTTSGPTLAEVRAVVAAMKAAAATEVVWAQDGETGRMWSGLRKNIPPGYEEVIWLESLPPPG